MVVVPRPVQETMSVLASAMNSRERSYRVRSCLKNSLSSYVPRSLDCEIGGMYPVTRVNERFEDLKKVATASIYPVNTKCVRPVSSTVGSLPTQMPPAAYLSSCDAGAVRAFLKEMRLKLCGVRGDVDFVSTRAIMSVLSSRVVS